ncbi:hypothetical protein GCM10010492_50700 [Saccharothrix mutabilis subsp. mutabilis]|uniref:Tetratricopeptide repeat protein n=2 Tax=Saccharothrix mutabilis TaxID=33921 RepID=A0ABN0UBS5_9PSEU
MREAHALNQAGWYAARVDDLEPAQRFCAEALEITRRHDDRDAEARVLDSLGYIAHLAGADRGRLAVSSSSGARASRAA